MPYITVGQENSSPIELYYEDLGSGQPVILIHGWPLNGASWEKQTRALLEAGYRVITYDRRGFGKSAKPSKGYDYETFTDDLHQVISELKLRDVILAGFSMGTGEVTHYLAKYGSDNVQKAILIGVIPPYLVKTPDNPTGVDKSVFEGISESLKKDRPAFLWQFLNNFYNYDALKEKRISEYALKESWDVALQAASIAAIKSVDSWMTDFRADLPKIDVPVLIIHGKADQILPFQASAEPLSKILKKARFVHYEDGPHGLLVTHADEVSQEMLKFLEAGVEQRKSMEKSEAAHARLQ